MMRRKSISWFAPLVLSLALAGCAAGPDYQRPQVEVPAAFKEAAGYWKPAQPQDQVFLGPWWEIYADPVLNALVEQVAISNQNVQAAAAQYRQALALLGAARAAEVPSINGTLSGNRAQGASASSAAPNTPLNNTVRLALSASWELDLWGRIARNVEANQATLQATEADLAAALLSAQATLAQTYFQLRANDVQQSLLNQAVLSYERSLQITRNRYAAGVAARIDVAQAQTQLQTTRAQLTDLVLQRAQYEHAIALLVGKAPANFQIAATEGLPLLPAVPASLPSTLLERRPDIVGAERRMAAANAQIGVAASAYFPTLSLGANAGYQSNSLNDLISQPYSFWSLGPSLALALFDGGARKAQTDSARAAYDKSVAAYRLTVLSAFVETEDNLATLRLLQQEADLQANALRYAEEALTLTENQYLAGTVSYLNVITAQATALNARRSVNDLNSRQLVANATLLKALGGSWIQNQASLNPNEK